VVIDRNPDCGITQTELLVDSPGGFPEPHLIVSEWMAFFADYLSRWASASDSTGTDAIVPSPLMPHLITTGFATAPERAGPAAPSTRARYRNRHQFRGSGLRRMARTTSASPNGCAR